jgi:hypothetical protein
MPLFSGAVGQHGFYVITNCQPSSIILVFKAITNAHSKATTES